MDLLMGQLVAHGGVGHLLVGGGDVVAGEALDLFGGDLLADLLVVDLEEPEALVGGMGLLARVLLDPLVEGGVDLAHNEGHVVVVVEGTIVDGGDGGGAER